MVGRFDWVAFAPVTSCRGLRRRPSASPSLTYLTLSIAPAPAESNLAGMSPASSRIGRSYLLAHLRRLTHYAENSAYSSDRESASSSYY